MNSLLQYTVNNAETKKSIFSECAISTEIRNTQQKSYEINGIKVLNPSATKDDSKVHFI